MTSPFCARSIKLGRVRLSAWINKTFYWHIINRHISKMIGRAMLHTCARAYLAAKHFCGCYIILMNRSPNNLAVNENLKIHRLKCTKPFGLNSNDPFGISLLDIIKLRDEIY